MNPEFQGSTLETIRQRGTVRVACQWGDSAEQYLDGEGNPAGVVAEMGRLLAHDLGVEASFTDLAWADHLPALADGRVDILMKHTNSPGRAFLADFSRHILLEYEGIVVVRHGDAAGGEGLLRDAARRAGATEGSIHAEVIARRFATVELVTYPNAFVGMKAVDEGGVDGFVTDQGLFDEATWLHDTCAPLRQSDGARVVVSRDASHPAVRVGDQRFLNWIDNWMDFHRRLGTIDHIIESAYLKKSSEGSNLID